jgi:hypothetical protein
MIQGLRPRERIAAILAPTAVFIVGAASPSRRSARLATAGVVVGSVVVETAIAVAARRSRPARPPKQPTQVAPSLHVVVPARDEAAVIGDLIGDLGRQDFRDRAGRPAFTLVIVDDRSTDGTGELVGSAIADAGLASVTTCIRRDDGPDGKGAALAVASIGDLPDDAIVLVLDADARLEPDGLSSVVRAFDADLAGITARRRMLVPGDGRRRWLARWQDDEQAVDGAIQQARLSMGGTGELRGNGMAVRADRLRTIGGWDAGALTEDLEATTQLVGMTGSGVRWTEEAEVWEQPALELAALTRQRLRWAEGAIRRDLRVTWPLVLTGRLPARLRLDLAAYAAQTLVPWLALGLLARGDRSAARRGLAALGAAYLLGGAAIAASAFGRVSPRVLGVIALSALWPVVIPVAWVRVVLSRGPIRFQKTTHAPGFSPPAPSDVRASGYRTSPRASARRPATTHPGAGATTRSQPPATANDGPRPGSAAPTSHRICP